jgi:hypothetical protein
MHRKKEEISIYKIKLQNSFQPIPPIFPLPVLPSKKKMSRRAYPEGPEQLNAKINLSYFKPPSSLVLAISTFLYIKKDEYSISVKTGIPRGSHGT